MKSDMILWSLIHLDYDFSYPINYPRLSAAQKYLSKIQIELSMN